MPGFWRMRFARVSATKMYKSGDRGQPCRAPLVSLIGSEAYPFLVTIQFTSVYSKRIHLRKPSPKFIFCITLPKNFQLRRSKAFSWFKLIIAMGNRF